MNDNPELLRTAQSRKPGTESSSFIFDLKTLLIESPSEFSAPKISAVTLNRLNYLGNLTSGAVAVISDLEISKMAEILGPASSSLIMIGCHGGEQERPGFDYSCSQESKAIINIRPLVKEFVRPLKPAYIENRKLSIAVHFGAAPELRAAIYEKLSKICKSLGEGFHVLEGHYCWEIKETRHNKGMAVLDLIDTPQFKERTPYFFGSDISCESAYLTINLRKGVTAHVYRSTRSNSSKKPVNSRAMFQLSGSNVLKNWIQQLCISDAIPKLPTETEITKRIAA